ncbi:MAG: Asp-tRNA(Asn)/Glu-tRNA(Gln) amidotransferase subunit GatB, partial [Limnothrix sp.]
GNMQEGSLRCDVNISVRPVGREKFGTKVEIKNMNSFSAIEKAINYEIERQIKAVEAGEPIYQETRLWDESSQRTFSMRMKEGASDYRYFPEPDLPPIEISKEQLEAIAASLPETPAEKRKRYDDFYGLSRYNIHILTNDRDIAEYFEQTCRHWSDLQPEGIDPTLAANWITQDIAAYLNKNTDKTIKALPLTAANLAELICLIDRGTISGKIAKEILPELLEKGGSPRAIVESRGLTQISDVGEIEAMIDELLAENPDKVEAYRGGKKKLQGFFVGQMMKKTSGRADPKLVNQLLNKKLNS